MGLGERAVVGDGAWVADRNAVVLPAFRDGKHLFDHLFGCHVGPGRYLDGNAVVSGGNLDICAADIDDQNFHLARILSVPLMGR